MSEKKSNVGVTIVAPVTIGVLVALFLVGFIVVSASVKGPANAEPATGEAVSSEAHHDHDMPGHDHEAMMKDAQACDFDAMVGKPVDQVALDALKRPVRILGPNSAATMDYSPERVSVHTDEQGTVTKVECN